VHFLPRGGAGPVSPDTFGHPRKPKPGVAPACRGFPTTSRPPCARQTDPFGDRGARFGLTCSPQFVPHLQFLGIFGCRGTAVTGSPARYGGPLARRERRRFLGAWPSRSDRWFAEQSYLMAPWPRRRLVRQSRTARPGTGVPPRRSRWVAALLLRYSSLFGAAAGGKQRPVYLPRKGTTGNAKPDIPANECIGIANAPCDFGHRGSVSGRPGWVTSVSVVARTQPTIVDAIRSRLRKGS
jgi:hypothetical protein